MATYLSASKLNLHLEVDPPFPDGMHPLRTVFLSLGLHEKLHFSPGGDDFRLKVRARPGIDPGPLEDNLVLRAARLASQAWGLSQSGGEFRLEKSYPSGSGLGSGSANAAAALLALRDAFRPELGRDQILPLASQLGADCAFFLTGGCAFGEGRGEKLTPLPEPEFPALVLRGEIPQNTALAYQALDRAREVSADGSESPDSSASTLSLRLPDAEAAKHWILEFWEDPPTTMRNDFDSILAALRPETSRYQEALRQQGAFLVGLAGSGSAVFGLFPDPVQRDRAAQALLLDPDLQPAPPWVLAGRTGGPGVQRIDAEGRP